jgi:two-component system, OmpR family, response regulator
MKDNSVGVGSVPLNIAFSQRPQLKALIVDDEMDIWYLLGNILKQRNIQTVFAGSLAEAGKLLSAGNDFSIIFLDNHLPDGSGISAIGQLKQRNPLAHLVMITAHDGSSDKEKAVRNGVDYFIGKPFSREIIFETLDKFSA